ncbi:unnamed protein product [Fraxinus pennsylvanica]|uniref:EF-hand domain-containing protein n=1 Tax=Fraxinus pennsylvanica TaxID=56036 RepID=A0AAD2E4P2_9LAMI|nr:unnamed protein product [Fraxinus pennsylvanica]
MEGIKEFAIAYYERATEEEKKKAQEYFNELDRNRDGKVSLLEFKKSVSSWLSSEKVFKQLDAKGKFEHEHSIRYFFDHHSLLRWFMYRRGKEERTQEKVNRRVNEESTQEKREMEELRKIAIAHFQAGSQQVQAKAQEFFNSMDSDGDGKIDLHEFLAFVSQEGLPQMHNPCFFKKLDRDGNGTLDFRESTKCDHNHNGRTQFLDNYTLLQAKQDSSLAIRINSNKVHPPNPSHGTVSTAIVPARKVNKWNAALKAFEVALAIGNISATMCTIL